MKDILVIVANASRARLYRVHVGVLERLESLSHPQSRSKGAELASDRPGRAFDTGTGPGPHRSGMEPETDPHEHEAEVFAREVARRGSILARRGRYPELLVVAPARFLGHVKSDLDAEIAKRIVATVSHDYTAKTDADLVEILQGLGVHVALPSPA
ncbi:MAG: host attachment protein [Pseudomonadota bacterium]|nr:host attachment protein [Pseudomonadota bacterium]